MIEFKWVDRDGNEVDDVAEFVVCEDGRYRITPGSDETGGGYVSMEPVDGAPEARDEVFMAVNLDYERRFFSAIMQSKAKHIMINF